MDVASLLASLSNIKVSRRMEEHYRTVYSGKYGDCKPLLEEQLAVKDLVKIVYEYLRIILPLEEDAMRSFIHCYYEEGKQFAYWFSKRFRVPRTLAEFLTNVKEPFPVLQSFATEQYNVIHCEYGACQGAAAGIRFARYTSAELGELFKEYRFYSMERTRTSRTSKGALPFTSLS